MCPGGGRGQPRSATPAVRVTGTFRPAGPARSGAEAGDPLSPVFWGFCPPQSVSGPGAFPGVR
eukprot:7764335-Lingulodinium_polyedra.AAC.1